HRPRLCLGPSWRDDGHPPPTGRVILADRVAAAEHRSTPKCPRLYPLRRISAWHSAFARFPCAISEPRLPHRVSIPGDLLLSRQLLCCSRTAVVFDGAPHCERSRLKMRSVLGDRQVYRSRALDLPAEARVHV